jgi:hypothetical protein
MKTIFLNLEILKLIPWVWICIEDIEYYIAYDADVINVLLTIAMFKPVEYLLEYLAKRKIKQE